MENDSLMKTKTTSTSPLSTISTTKTTATTSSPSTTTTTTTSRRSTIRGGGGDAVIWLQDNTQGGLIKLMRPRGGPADQISTKTLLSRLIAPTLSH